MTRANVHWQQSSADVRCSLERPSKFPDDVRYPSKISRRSCLSPQRSGIAFDTCLAISVGLLHTSSKLEHQRLCKRNLILRSSATHQKEGTVKKRWPFRILMLTWCQSAPCAQCFGTRDGPSATLCAIAVLSCGNAFVSTAASRQAEQRAQRRLLRLLVNESMLLLPLLQKGTDARTDCFVDLKTGLSF